MERAQDTKWKYTKRFYSTKAASIFPVFLVLVLWSAVVGFGIVSDKYLCPPWEIINEFVTLVETGYAGASLFDHFLASLGRTLTGFGFGCALAIPVGLFVGYYRRVDGAITPILAFLCPFR